MHRHGNDGGGGRTGRVDDGFQVRVVKVEGVRGDAVDQRGTGHVNLFFAAQHAGLCGGLQHRNGRQRGIGCLVTGRTDLVVAGLRARPHDVVVVTNEVGLGVVPEHRSGRLFRDLLGTVNQRVAAACDEVAISRTPLACNVAAVAKTMASEISVLKAIPVNVSIRMRLSSEPAAFGVMHKGLAW